MRTQRNFRLISLYTIDTPYEHEAPEWASCVEALGLPYTVYPAQNQRSWARNTQLKATCIRQALDQFPDTNIVWVDIDARVYKDPGLFDRLEADIACAVVDDEVNAGQLNSATVFVRNNAAARRLVDAWVDLNARQVTRYGDQDNLQTLIEDARASGEIIFERLPTSYAKIFDRPSHAGEDDIIVQYQASRRYRF